MRSFIMGFEIDNQVFEQFPLLETERLILRTYDIADAQYLFELRSNPQVMAHMDSHPYKSVKDAVNMIEKNLQLFEKKDGIIWTLVEKSSNHYIGDLGYWRLIREHCRAEIGYMLHPDYWRKGYMKEAMMAMIPFGFSELKLHSIEANVNPKNEASAHLLKSIGFRQEAHFRENYLFDDVFYDSHIFSLLESDIT
jgi:ribosomal-protein-alanine N-acetyltransferase